MAAIEDLNATLDDTSNVVNAIAAKITQLEAGAGVPEGQVAAANSKAAAIRDQLQAIVNQS